MCEMTPAKLAMGGDADADSFIDSQKLPSEPLMESMSTFFCSFIALFPLLCCISLSTGWNVLIPYTMLQFASAVVGYAGRHWSQGWRLSTGFICVIILASYKSGVLLPIIPSFGVKMIVYAFTALWECSNCSLILCEKEHLTNSGILSYTRALIAACAPCQIRFTDDITKLQGKVWRRTVHLTLFLLGGSLFWLGLRRLGKSTIESLPLPLQVEAMTILSSLFVLVFDIPAHMWQLIMMTFYSKTADSRDLLITTILPYGAIYFSANTKEFWGKWSRPATKLIRHLLFHPLGGNQRPLLVIPLMFFLNARAHYDLSLQMIGYPAANGWNFVFGILACSAFAEVVVTRSLQTYEGELPSWLKVVMGLMAHISLRLALFVMASQCFQLTLPMLLGIDNV